MNGALVVVDGGFLSALEKLNGCGSCRRWECWASVGNEFKRRLQSCIVAREMDDAKPVRCQKCGKPLGYVTVLAKGLTSLPQLMQDVKIVAVCMECSRRGK